MALSTQTWSSGATARAFRWSAPLAAVRVCTFALVQNTVGLDVQHHRRIICGRHQGSDEMIDSSPIVATETGDYAAPDQMQVSARTGLDLTSLFFKV
jgi:hypothetical protein